MMHNKAYDGACEELKVSDSTRLNPPHSVFIAFISPRSHTEWANGLSS
jgi:hypothetical protein